jgi:crotonobetainyl-CoA:carnitine CoA-transferase CaiB-like acyl-CoA transferase
VRRRLKITYDDLAPLNGRLIYAFSDYGEAGPEADKPGFDATAWWARTGLMHLVRAGEEATPARSLPGMGDHPSAMATYGAIVAALYQRERTGYGGYVGSSLLANGLWVNGCSVQAALCGEKVVPQPRRAWAQCIAGALPLPRRPLAALVGSARRMALGNIQGMPWRHRTQGIRALQRIGGVRSMRAN